MQNNTEGRTPQFVLLYLLGDIKTAARTATHNFVATLSQPIRTRALVQILRQIFKVSVADLPEPIAEEIRRQEEDKSLKVLLVEDVYINAIVATTMLRNLGHSVDVAENGRIALEKLRQNDYDLALMDCQMPEMDGYQCTQQLRDSLSGVRNPKIPVIAMTAHALVGEREKCLESGMDDYVTKPIDRTALIAAINRWVGKQSTSPLTKKGGE